MLVKLFSFFQPKKEAATVTSISVKTVENGTKKATWREKLALIEHAANYTEKADIKRVIEQNHGVTTSPAVTLARLKVLLEIYNRIGMAESDDAKAIERYLGTHGELFSNTSIDEMLDASQKPHAHASP